ncbi:MAG TPA: LysM peptidoglycan-binding domain-containing protein [Flavipsychrobacter sp.]|nr:LysM peptidoglycan-binding domain-containing protein [Flavipsychrobacter sp.]
MKQNIVLILLLLFVSFSSFAKNDSLFVWQGEDGWILKHKVKTGETVFSIARNYHIPPVMLGEANEINIQEKPAPGSMLFIPLGAYNLKSDGIQTGEMRPLYHRLRTGESLKRLAKNSNVTQRRLMDWNNSTEDDIYEGQTLFVGWLLYDGTSITSAPATASPPKQGASTPVSSKPGIPASGTSTTQQRLPPTTPAVKGDTTYVIYLPKTVDTTEEEKSEAETLFDAQTMEGTRVSREKGPAAFFKSANSNASFYYAFHNTAPKGTIIKVRNINNGKTVFVKVLGLIPQTGMYHNAIIGISSGARAALDIRDEKAWCELTYAK